MGVAILKNHFNLKIKFVQLSEIIKYIDMPLTMKNNPKIIIVYLLDMADTLLFNKILNNCF